jgi:TfoX/Sxy family transcriptional regulator of competence genes
MAYDEALAGRVRRILGDRRGISERRMFGGLCFMVDDKMFMGINDGEVMCRVGPDAHDEAMSRPGVRVMDFTGRPMLGYVYAGSPSIDSDDGLRLWVEQTYAFADALPAKTPKKSSSPPAKRR